MKFSMRVAVRTIIRNTFCIMFSMAKQICLCVLKSIFYLRNFGNAADGIRLFEVFVVFIVLFLYFAACSFFLDKVLSKLLSSFASSKDASVFALVKVLLLKVWNRYWQWIITNKYFIFLCFYMKTNSIVLWFHFVFTCPLKGSDIFPGQLAAYCGEMHRMWELHLPTDLYFLLPCQCHHNLK